MHKGNSNVRADEIASRSSRHLACYSRLAQRCLLFCSRASAVEIIAFTVLCNAIVSRIEGFLWAYVAEDGAFVGYVGRYTRCILMHTGVPPGTPSIFSFRAETVIPRGNALSLSFSALSFRENFLRCLIIFRPKTFLGPRRVYYHPLRLRGHPALYLRGRKTASGYKIRANCDPTSRFLYVSGRGKRK